MHLEKKLQKIYAYQRLHIETDGETVIKKNIVFTAQSWFILTRQPFYFMPDIADYY